MQMGRDVGMGLLPIQMDVTNGRGVCRLTSMPHLSVQTQAILAALLQDISRPRYGLEMAKEAGLPSGTIYPILARLEREGWVESEPEDIDASVAGRRPRRYYHLTRSGASVASAEIKSTVQRLRPRPLHGQGRARDGGPARV
jgi:PadR family transcriptional regulator, regulatory protein PadR